ncbi:hypothetical protein [Siphonobacter aquaeclarae]|uniref:Uncharacterized protein n=1 Tax=Siphonobacter aquaeclarae TaxID=563176 RepID=A0A1G9TA05_9BACT|nr:hypothetical protein [Siphonobacter aquaeclarae]SDM44438.1 hypothetical protein SAMN04488090_3474 [Siphonobacter aquaeclarae]
MAVEVKNNTINTAVWFIIILVVYFILRADAKKRRQAEEYDRVASGSDENARFAYLLHNAFNPGGKVLGVSLIDMDGTDKKALFEIATQIKTFSAVSIAYENLYSEALADRLSQELSVSDLQTFYSLINKKPASVNPVAGTTKVVALVPTNALDPDKPTSVMASWEAGDEIGTYLGEIVWMRKDAAGNILSRNQMVVVTWKNVYGFGMSRTGWVYKANVRFQ